MNAGSGKQQCRREKKHNYLRVRLSHLTVFRPPSLSLSFFLNTKRHSKTTLTSFNFCLLMCMSCVSVLRSSRTTVEMQRDSGGPDMRVEKQHTFSPDAPHHSASSSSSQQQQQLQGGAEMQRAALRLSGCACRTFCLAKCPPPPPHRFCYYF